MKNYIQDGDFRSVGLTVNADPVTLGNVGKFWTCAAVKTVSAVTRGTYALSVVPLSSIQATPANTSPVDLSLTNLLKIAMSSPTPQTSGGYYASVTTKVPNGNRIFSGYRARLSFWVNSSCRQIGVRLHRNGGTLTNMVEQTQDVLLTIAPGQWQRASVDFSIPAFVSTDSVSADNFLSFDFIIDNVTATVFNQAVAFVESSTAAIPFTAITGVTLERIGDASIPAYEPATPSDVSQLTGSSGSSVFQADNVYFNANPADGVSNFRQPRVYPLFDIRGKLAGKNRRAIIPVPAIAQGAAIGSAQGELDALALWLDSGSSGTTVLIHEGTGVSLDSGGTAGSSWANFSATTTQSVVDFVCTVSAVYNTGTASDSHGGIGLRYVDPNNWAALVMLCPNGDVHIRDRVAGTEFQDDVTGAGIVPGGLYRVRIDNSAGNSATINVWELLANGGTGSHLVTNKVHAFHAGVPATGICSIHTFAAAMRVLQCQVTDWSAGSGVVTCQDPFWINSGGSTQVIPSGGGTGSEFAFNGGTGWCNLISDQVCSDGIITGVMSYTARTVGVSFRSDGNAAWNGYIAFYDSNNSFLRIVKVVAGVQTTLATGPATLVIPANRLLPFSLSFRGTSIVFKFGGQALSVTDATYTNGFVGVTAFGGAVTFDEVEISP